MVGIIQYHFIIHRHCQSTGGFVDLDKDAHIAIEYAFASGTVAAAPGQVIVILHLHHLVPLSKDGAIDVQLFFAFIRRIEGFLQPAV